MSFDYDDLQRAALSYVLEDETWSAFLEWFQAHHVSDEARAWWVAGPDLPQARREWVLHSKDPMIRALAILPAHKRGAAHEPSELQPLDGQRNL